MRSPHTPACLSICLGAVVTCAQLCASERAAAETHASEDRMALIEDAEDGNETILPRGNRGGVVYAYGDEQGSRIEPSPEAFRVTPGGALGSKYALCVRGTLADGADVFAGLGLSFTEPKAPYNAAAYQGVAFLAKRGPGSVAAVRLKVPDINTDPDGKQCKDCYNDFGISFDLTEDWTRYEVRFADLKQEGGWGDPRPDSLDTSKLFGLQWQVTARGASFDICIDSITFLRSAPTAAAAAGSEEREAKESRRAPGQPPAGVGLDPSDLTVGDLMIPTQVTSTTWSGPDDFRFSYHGYIRLPLRIGIGSGEDAPAGVSKSDKWHTEPRIPDGTYTDWRFLSNPGVPWAELRLTYANANVAANVAIASYDITDGSYGDLQAQLGINQAFVTLSFPDLYGPGGGLVANVGVFSNRYGAAGRYGAGKYETYLMGATHVAGENLRAFWDLSDRITVHLEHGFGGKLQAAPFLTGAVADVPYLPYPGPERQGATLLHHAHAGVSWKEQLTLGLHYLTTWTADSELASEKDGRITVLGVDLKLIGSNYGEGYLGYSYVEAKDPLRIAGALEVLHSFEGWSLCENFFGPDAGGSGDIHTLLFQYTFSVASFLHRPQEWWGEGPDLLISAFGMYSKVESHDAEFTAGREKLKVGADVVYVPVSWFSATARFDTVMPDLDADEKSFHVLSPRIAFHSTFASHEQVFLQYSRYFYNEGVAPAWPYEERAPDENVLTLGAMMWW